MPKTVNGLWMWALAIFSAHNLEETLALKSGWAEQHFPALAWTAAWWRQFGIAALALTLTISFVAWRLRNTPKTSLIWLRVFLWIMLLNAVWHLGVAAYTLSLAPGLLTAVFLIAPAYSAALIQTKK